MTLTERPATELAGRLARRELSAREVVAAHLERIAARDPQLNAFLTVAAGAALARADALDALPAPAGPLHGLPVSIKDLVDTAGLRTTYGSALFADHVPAANDLVVERIERAGGVVIGKTNTPEFGFGAVCTNPLLGPTRNPFDPDLTSGGSSGGAAVSVATGMAALAHGTDFGGSVRVPASFCGVVSIRPTPGLVPAPGRALGWDTLSTHGTIARSVDDCALLLAAMAGADPRDPTSFVPSVPDHGARPRLAATADFGVAPVARAVRALFEAAVDGIARAAGPVVRRSPECGEAAATLRTLRAAHVLNGFGPLLAKDPERITPTLRWNIEAGRGITAEQYLSAQAARTRLYRGFAALFREVDVLVAPACCVLPWPNEDGEVTAIDGRPVETILDYLAVTTVITLIGFPVLTLPAGRSADGIPFGVQLIARPGEEALLLRLGRALEAAGFAWEAPGG
ncbi:amidase [Azospirillum sp. RWY-5-1]|uniref:Amidase n=1 Tax=Azospirillum oleiclasticum TaxID=2735135 RepID=A0ABX2THE8_9PROT|nr:amidase [Azospirillum oleiclasticum]NYZ15495.1 amidase [Azospirillum oleiclasticum]NYZ22518.1 amidase [Azospirillum oleiclasticum]